MKRKDLGIRVISFSGGRSSALMLKLLQENGEINDKTLVCFANTGMENDETLDFVNACSVNWKIEVNWLEYVPKKPFFRVVDYASAARKPKKGESKDGNPFWELVKKRVFLPNVARRFCTGDLKVKTIRRFVRDLGHSGHIDTFLGLRYDEPNRVSKKKAQNDKGTDPEIYFMPLHDFRVGKADVNTFWQLQPFKLEIPDAKGNCDLCFMKGERNIIRMLREDPSMADNWVDMENLITATTGLKSKKRSQFHKKWSYRDLLKIAVEHPEFDFGEEFDPFSIDCGCSE